jgi:hypothetical protein
LSGRQDRVMVAKKCGAFKAERHRDENEVVILGACAVQVYCHIIRGWGTMCGVRRDVESLRVQDLGSHWRVNRDAEAETETETEADVGVLEDTNRAGKSARLTRSPLPILAHDISRGIL